MFAEGGYDEFQEYDGNDEWEEDNLGNASDKSSGYTYDRSTQSGGRGRGRTQGMYRGRPSQVYQKLAISLTAPKEGEKGSEASAVTDLAMLDPQLSGSKREEMELRSQKEGLTPDAKKKWLVNAIIHHQRRLCSSDARTNELHKSKLQRDWEPSCSSRATRFSEVI